MTVNYALQDQFLELFFETAIGGDFYLTGGTALARFYFHHRESLDLDFFTHNQTLDFDSVNRAILGIGTALNFKIISQVVTATFLQYIFTDESGATLKIDAVRDIPIRFGEIALRGKVRLDTLENIGSNKVLAIFGRADAKDFIDLYWILHQTVLTFDHLFRLAKEKDLGLSELYFAYSVQNIVRLNHFPQMLQPLPWDEMVAYFQGLVQELLARIKPAE